MKAPVHPQEAQRLNALRRFDILDSPREAEFDEVVELAAKICGRPISVINLIDSDRQWFKAETGLGVRETPLETSICAHVILEGDFVEIPDTLADPRMRDNPLCLADPGLRFYAGAVLRTDDGQAIGTLCVLDYATGHLSELQRETLRVLAAQVMARIELRLALKTEALLRKEIDHRVKNSLQMVMAFAQLQRKANEVDADERLSAVVRQVGAVALLHGLLSYRDDHQEIDIANYMANLVDVLVQTAPKSITITGQFELLTAIPETASALGMITNELVTNSLKYSFGADGEGTIALTGSRNGNIYRVECIDNGQGHKSSSPGGGLGKQIMAAAVQKINGSLVSGPAINGYRSVLEFPFTE